MTGIADPAWEVPRVEYFDFEEDFVEDDMRCIPMIVRYKLDTCCIKLKLREWSVMTPRERTLLASLPCASPEDISVYRTYLAELVRNRTGQAPTELPHAADAAWSGKDVPDIVRSRLDEHVTEVSDDQWNGLSILQRFALFKLSSSAHEHKNFARALKEFKLV